VTFPQWCQCVKWNSQNNLLQESKSTLFRFTFHQICSGFKNSLTATLSSKFATNWFTRFRFTRCHRWRLTCDQWTSDWRRRSGVLRTDRHGGNSWQRLHQRQAPEERPRQLPTVARQGLKFVIKKTFCSPQFTRKWRIKFVLKNVKWCNHNLHLHNHGDSETLWKLPSLLKITQSTRSLVSVHIILCSKSHKTTLNEYSLFNMCTELKAQLQQTKHPYTEQNLTTVDELVFSQQDTDYYHMDHFSATSVKMFKKMAAKEATETIQHARINSVAKCYLYLIHWWKDTHISHNKKFTGWLTVCTCDNKDERHSKKMIS